MATKVNKALKYTNKSIWCWPHNVLQRKSTKLSNTSTWCRPNHVWQQKSTKFSHTPINQAGAAPTPKAGCNESLALSLHLLVHSDKLLCVIFPFVYLPSSCLLPFNFPLQYGFIIMAFLLMRPKYFNGQFKKKKFFHRFSFSLPASLGYLYLIIFISMEYDPFFCVPIS